MTFEKAADVLMERTGALAESGLPLVSQVSAAAHGALTALPQEWLHLSFMVFAAVVMIVCFLAPLAGFSTYVERRIAARMQARIGCDRVGPEGVFQFVADGLKLLAKEDLVPRGANRFLFLLAPFLVIVGAYASFVTIPFSPSLVAADLNVGLVYVLAASSLCVVGILIAGWASNNKWSLLGSMRSAAQIVSYEIPLALSLLVPILIVGSLSLSSINAAQAGGITGWIIWKAPPAALVAFVIYFIASLAEVNRTPFDLPEAESELVSGYGTEYSGIRWGLFFMGEYANMFLVSAIAVTAFLGGWQASAVDIPVGAAAAFFGLFFFLKSLNYFLRLAKGLLRGASLWDLISTVRTRRFSKAGFIAMGAVSLLAVSALMAVAGDSEPVRLAMFVSKAYFFVFVMIWLRWTLPRMRIDHLMGFCWKGLVPVAFACVFFTALFLAVAG